MHFLSLVNAARYHVYLQNFKVIFFAYVVWKKRNFIVSIVSEIRVKQVILDSKGIAEIFKNRMPFEIFDKWRISLYPIIVAVSDSQLTFSNYAEIHLVTVKVLNNLIYLALIFIYNYNLSTFHSNAYFAILKDYLLELLLISKFDLKFTFLQCQFVTAIRLLHNKID